MSSPGEFPAGFVETPDAWSLLVEALPASTPPKARMKNSIVPRNSPMVATVCPRASGGRTSKRARKICLRGSARPSSVRLGWMFIVVAREG